MAPSRGRDSGRDGGQSRCRSAPHSRARGDGAVAARVHGIGPSPRSHASEGATCRAPGDNATDRGLQAVPGQPRVTSPPAVPGRGWARHWAPSRGRFTGVRDAPAPQVGPARRRLTPTVHLRDARPGLRGPGCAGRVLGRKTRGPVAPRAAPTLPASQTGRPRKWAGRAGTAQGLRGVGCLPDSGGLALILIAVPREGRAPAATS